MSDTWKTSRLLVGFGEKPEYSWPAMLDLRFTLSPSDLYGVEPHAKPHVVLYTTGNMTVEHSTGQIRMTEAELLPEFKLDRVFTFGKVSISGNIMHIKCSAKDSVHLDSILNFFTTVLSEFASIQTGVITEVIAIEGTVDGCSVELKHSPENWTLWFTRLDPHARETAFDAAFSFIPPLSPSYPRYVACSRYYYQALRLLSSQQSSSTPPTYYVEVLLNLAKCLDFMFQTPSRDELRRELRKLGYSAMQVESQVISILVVRNELDVGHPSSGGLTKEETRSIRRFVERSVQNVSALLKRVAKEIESNPTLLRPLPVSGRSTSRKLISKLSAFCAELPLDPNQQNPAVIHGNDSSAAGTP